MAKANKLEMLERERLINELICKGTSKLEIVQAIAGKYKIAERTAEHQYFQILKKMADDVSKDRELVRMELLKQLEEVQKGARADGSHKIVMEVIMNKAKLLGLNEKMDTPTERPKTLIYKEKDMSGILAVVPPQGKVENE